MKPIGIDVDGVLASFNRHYVPRIKNVTGRDLFPKGEVEQDWSVPCWTYETFYGYTPEEVSAVWTSIKSDPDFWARLPPYPDAVENLGILHWLQRINHRDIYFVTARVGQTAKRQTEWWLDRYGFPSATVLISKHKGLAVQTLSLTAYIDDRWENAMEVAAAGATSYLLNRSYNQNYPSDGLIRVNTMKEMLDQLKD